MLGGLRGGEARGSDFGRSDNFPRLWFLQASSAVDAGGAAVIPRASGPAITSRPNSTCRLS